MAPPPKFTRAQLQAAALELVDREGLSALSMRSLARALGTGAMTLYTYVGDRQGLDALVIDAVMAGAPRPTQHDDWPQAVRALAYVAWQAVRAHPNAIPLILARRVEHEATLAHGEALLSATAASGLSGEKLLAAFRTVHGFVMGLAQTHAAGARAGSSDPALVRGGTLPPELYPRLREAAAAAAQADPDRQFHTGMDIVLAGIAATAAAASAGR